MGGCHVTDSGSDLFQTTAQDAMFESVLGFYESLAANLHARITELSCFKMRNRVGSRIENNSSARPGV
jgi:hypothetical protein